MGRTPVSDKLFGTCGMSRSTFKPLLYLVLAMIILVLSGFSTYLYRQNIRFREWNRELTIKNDSIMSVNIELNSALELKNARTIKAYQSISNLQRSK